MSSAELWSWDIWLGGGLTTMGYMRKDGLVERIPPFLIVIALPVLFFCGSAGFWTASGTDGRQDVRTGRLSLQAPCPLLGEGEDGIPACSFYLTQTPDLEARNTRHDGDFFCRHLTRRWQNSQTCCHCQSALHIASCAARRCRCSRYHCTPYYPRTYVFVCCLAACLAPFCLACWVDGQLCQVSCRPRCTYIQYTRGGCVAEGCSSPGAPGKPAAGISSAAADRCGAQFGGCMFSTRRPICVLRMYVRACCVSELILSHPLPTYLLRAK